MHRAVQRDLVDAALKIEYYVGIGGARCDVEHEDVRAVRALLAVTPEAVGAQPARERVAAQPAHELHADRAGAQAVVAGAAHGGLDVAKGHRAANAARAAGAEVDEHRGIAAELHAVEPAAAVHRVVAVGAAEQETLAAAAADQRVVAASAAQADHLADVRFDADRIVELVAGERGAAGARGRHEGGGEDEVLEPRAERHAGALHELHRVDAAAVEDRVAVRHIGVVARAAVERVEAGAAVERIVALAPGDAVGAVHAAQGVVPGQAAQGVLARAAGEAVAGAGGARRHAELGPAIDHADLRSV